MESLKEELMLDLIDQNENCKEKRNGFSEGSDVFECNSVTVVMVIT